MKRFLRKIIWRLIRPTVKFEWGVTPVMSQPYCKIYILGQLACDVRANYYDKNRLVFEEVEDLK